jgi:hypothetical protein
MTEVLYAAAWIVGEYRALIPHAVKEEEDDDDDENDDTHSECTAFDGVILTLVKERNLSLPPHVQGVYMQGLFVLVFFFSLSLSSSLSGLFFSLLLMLSLSRL